MNRFHELSQFQIDPETVRIIDRETCLRYGIVLLGKYAPGQDSPMTLGMVDPTASLIINEVASALKRTVTPVRLNAYEIRRALDIGHGITSTEDAEGRLRLHPMSSVRNDPELPVGAVLEDILGLAIAQGASDIHIETYEDDVDVRLRVDGVLRQISVPLSRDNIDNAISRLKVLSQLDLAERRRAQDGRIMAVFERPEGERLIDFRLSIVPGPFGEDAVLRVLDSASTLRSLDELGLPGPIRTSLEALFRNPEGLLLVTGPTGSGKTTTLYSMLNIINTPENKVLTVEDPVEYHFSKMNQKQVSGQMGFADYARAFMRQNPDIILIGEIRDEETADAAMRAAQTGHLVFSTLHTADSVRSVSRLRTLGVENSLIANSLLGCLAQRLARRLCLKCRVEARPTPEQTALFGLPADQRVFKPRGCEACGGSGYKGRVGIYELLVVDEDIAALIAEQAPIHDIRKAALTRKGMVSLVKDAMDKVCAGTTSIEEMLRIVPYRAISEHREITG